MQYTYGFDWLSADTTEATRMLPADVTAKWTKIVNLTSTLQDRVGEIIPGTTVQLVINAKADSANVVTE
jgi:hypothetical protein